MNSQIKFLCQASHVQRMPKTEALQCDLKTLFSKCWVVFKIHSGDLVLHYLNTFCVLWRSFTMEHRDEQKLETNKNLWSLTNKTTYEPSKKWSQTNHNQNYTCFGSDINIFDFIIQISAPQINILAEIDITKIK